jgi:hypothetical protein
MQQQQQQQDSDRKQENLEEDDEDEYESEEEEEPKYPIDKKLLDCIFSYDGQRDAYGYYEGHGKLSFYHESELEYNEEEDTDNTTPENVVEEEEEEEEQEQQVLVTITDTITTNATTEEPSLEQQINDHIKPLSIKYEGGFTQGLMNGHGVLRWNDGSTYNGSIQNNVLNGTGRFTWSDGSYYEGPVLNGLRHGRGFYYNGKTKATYEGDWIDGKRHGNGKITYSKSEWFEGQFQNNQRNGIGTMYYKSGNVYSGEWRNEQIHGNGTMIWSTLNEKYEGGWQYSKQQGYGKHTFYQVNKESCNHYEGYFKFGTRDGYGVFYYSDGSKYEGEWKNNMKHGRGEYFSSNGSIQRCLYNEDKVVKSIQENSNTSTGSGNNGDEDNEELTKNEITRQHQTTKNDPDYVPLYIQDLIVKSGSEDDVVQIQRLISRYIHKLKQVFAHYSKYGVNPEIVKMNEKALEEELDLNITGNTTPDPFSRPPPMLRMNSKADSINLSVSINSTNNNHLHLPLDFSSGGMNNTIAGKKKVIVELVEKQVAISKQSDMNMLQFWKFSKDCGFLTRDRLSFAAIDRIFITSRSRAGELLPLNRPSQNFVRFASDLTSETVAKRKVVQLRPMSSQEESDFVSQLEQSLPAQKFSNNETAEQNYHSPENKMRFREFVEALARIASVIYDKSGLSLSSQIQKLVEDDVLKRFEEITGNDQKILEALFMRQKEEFEPVINDHIADLDRLFKYYSVLSSGKIIAKKHASDLTMTVRQFLRFMKDVNMIDNGLSLHSILSLFDQGGELDEIVPELVVDKEIIFAEFLEAIIRCSMIKQQNSRSTSSIQSKRPVPIQLPHNENKKDEVLEEQLVAVEQQSDNATAEEEQQSDPSTEYAENQTDDDKSVLEEESTPVVNGYFDQFLKNLIANALNKEIL